MTKHHIDEDMIRNKFDKITIEELNTLKEWSSVKGWRLFDCLYFDRAGTASVNDSVILHARLSLGLSIISKFNQGSCVINDDLTDEEKRRKQMSIDLDREMLHKIVMDFAAALTGREIEFGEELKYPGEKIRNHPLETLEYLRQQKKRVIGR